MKRLNALREELVNNEIDAIFLHQRENVLYMTGFTGTTSGLFVTKEKALLLVDGRYEEQAKQQCEGYEVVLSSRPFEIGKVLSGEKTVGFEENVLTYEEYNLLQEEADDGTSFIPATAILKKMRLVKDEEELIKLRQAVKIADDAFHHILPFIKEGVYEIDIANEMDFYMRKQGATGPSFDFIIAGGARSALPHGVAGKNKLKAHEPVLMDYGCVYENYCSDITRTVFLGEPNEEAKALYRIVSEGQKRGYACSMVGKPVALADQGVRDFFQKCELDDYFTHSLGHGVGLEIHEDPTVNSRNLQKFKNGMVYTIEPGLYLPGVCGVRIEDMVLMTYQGPEKLTGAPKDLIIL
jgi:Xaa-Pro aminopeptidase